LGVVTTIFFVWLPCLVCPFNLLLVTQLTKKLQLYRKRCICEKTRIFDSW